MNDQFDKPASPGISATSEDSGASGRSPGAPENLVALDYYDGVLVAGGYLLVGRSEGAQVIVQAEVESVLGHCQVFRTLEEHARYLADKVPQLGGRVDDARRVLAQIDAGGLFISAQKICEAHEQAGFESEMTRDCQVHIITCDRPEALSRLLDSMQAQACLSGCSGLTVIDDSRDERVAAANRKLLERVALACPVPVHYFGDRERHAFLAGLVAAVPEQRQAIEFLLGEGPWQGYKTYGRSRNYSLLLAAGSRVVIFDDDVLCEARWPEARSEASPGQLAFGNGQRETRFYTSEIEWRAQSRACDFNPVAGHAKHLGASLRELLRAVGPGALSPALLEGQALETLDAGMDGARVLLTQAGTLGDPGTGSNAWLLTIDERSQRAMLAKPGALEAALARGPVWRGQSRPTLGHRAVMSQVTGLDNRVELPPYFPVFRGEDFLFGYMLAYLFPAGFVLDQDWAVPHLPLDSRQSEQQLVSALPRAGFNLLSAYLERSRPLDSAVSYEVRLQLLIDSLRELSELSEPRLLAQYRRHLSAARATILGLLTDRVKATGELSPAWSELLQANMREIAQAIQVPARLADLADDAGLSERQTVEQLRAFTAGFANALQGWRAIREAAASLAGSAGS